MADSDVWLTVQQAFQRHAVPRRTIYGFIERKLIKTREIRGKKHVLESDLLTVLAERAAASSAAQTPAPGPSGTQARGPDDLQLHASRRHLEELRVAARTAEVESDLRRAKDAMAVGEAERLARAEETRLSCERGRLALAKESFEFEELRRQKEREAEIEEARRRDQLRAEQEERDRVRIHEEWVGACLEGATWYTATFFDPMFTARAREVTRQLLLDFSPATPQKVIETEIAEALWREFGKYPDLLIDHMPRELQLRC
jgi:hypothetical protein